LPEAGDCYPYIAIHTTDTFFGNNRRYVVHDGDVIFFKFNVTAQKKK
jgi:hypothetical protein